MFNFFADVKNQVATTLGAAADGLNNTLFGSEEVSDDPFAVSRKDDKNADDKEASGADLLAHAEFLRKQHLTPLEGQGYNLSFSHHKHKNEHPERPYFYASPDGAPFPSYHTNPMPNFPSRWTQIENSLPPCENLTAPRIRLAPKELTEKRDTFEKIRFTAEEEWKMKKNKGSNKNKNKMKDEGEKDVDDDDENDELACLNLGYQCLGDPYQYEAFVTFMDLNRNVKILNLTDNQLEDINDLNLDSVVKLHLSNNNFVSFDALPSLPNCEELYLTENFVSGLGTIKQSQFPKLRVLTLLHNPVALMAGYRKQLKNRLPSLEYVDGLRVMEDKSTILDLIIGNDEE